MEQEPRPIYTPSLQGTGTKAYLHTPGLQGTGTKAYLHTPSLQGTGTKAYLHTSSLPTDERSTRAEPERQLRLVASQISQYNLPEPTDTISVTQQNAPVSTAACSQDNKSHYWKQWSLRTSTDAVNEVDICKTARTL